MAEAARLPAATPHEKRSRSRQLSPRPAPGDDARENIRLINELHQRCCERVKQGAELLVEAKSIAEELGERLLIERQKIRAGDWLLWLEMNCPTLPERTAQHYMQLAGRKPLPGNEATRKLADSRPWLQALRKLFLVAAVIKTPLPITHMEPANPAIGEHGVQVELLGLYVKRWIATVFRSRFPSADRRQLEYWRDYLRPAADAYREIEKRLADLDS